MTPPDELKHIVEAVLLAAGRPLSLEAIQALFPELECPAKADLRKVLDTLIGEYAGRGIEIAEVASGWRIQVREPYAPWVARLWDERPARYSRALMETLALIAYRQPITRGEIEDIRGVSVSTNIIKTLQEREWIRVVGQRDVPGRPSLYGTTRDFLDYFGLQTLDDLPTLAELRDLDEINRELDLSDPTLTDAADAAQSDTGDAKLVAGQDVAAQVEDDAVAVGDDMLTGPAQEVPIDAARDADGIEAPDSVSAEAEAEADAEGDGLPDDRHADDLSTSDDRLVDEHAAEREPEPR